jgi:cysteinyl-tRNA synthetase
MSQKYLGDTLDIHGGGKDLIFPHHENEIAQAEGATGKSFVRYWLHNGFVNIDKEKMSKSLGNFLTIKEIVKAYHPEVVRFFLLSRHYRSPLDYSTEGMEEARRNLERFYQTLAGIDGIIAQEKASEPVPEGLSPEEMAFYRRAEEFPNQFEEAMDDDFNTAVAIAALFELSHDLNRILQNPSPHAPQILQKGREAFAVAGEVLGIFQEDPHAFLEGEKLRRTKALMLSEQEIEGLITERNEARKNKDWTRADEIRGHLASQGIVLEDGPEGTGWRVQ